MFRRVAAFGLLSIFALAARAEPATSPEACMRQLAAVVEAVGRLKMSDEMEERVDAEIARIRTYCSASHFDEADRAAALALRLATGEIDPE